MSTDRSIERDDEGRIVVGWTVLTALVRAMIIEVSGELLQDRDCVTFVVDQHPVGALRSDTAHEPLRVTVRSWRPRRNLHRVDALGGEHRVERCGVFRVPIADEEPELGDPLAGRNRWPAGQPPGCAERYANWCPLVEVRGRCVRQGYGGWCPHRCGGQAGSVRPELDDVPSEDFPRQPDDQLPKLAIDHRASWAVRVGPSPVIRRRCHASSVPGVTMRCRRSSRGSSRVNADRTARSGHEARGLPT